MRIARAPIANRIHLVHWCEPLSASVAGTELDAETIVIVRGNDEQWYLQDTAHRPLCRAVHCPGCGLHLENALRHVRVMHTGRDLSLHLPLRKGLS